MNGFITMLKMNLKLLLRNKGYLAFIIILPLISVVMLNIRNINTTEGKEETYYKIQEIKDDIAIMDMIETKICIKVYDCSKSEISDYLIKELANTGTYRIYRYREEKFGLKEARKKALKSANSSIVDAVIYIPSSFETQLLKGKQSNITLFKVTKDERIKILENTLNANIDSVADYARAAGYQKTELNQLLKAATDHEMSKKVVNIEVGNEIHLTSTQQNNRSSIGYSLAFLTIGFLFSGIFIAATIVDERQNRVYNRVLLSTSSLGTYGLVKLVIVLLTVLIQTGILAVAIKLFVKTEFGIPFSSYLFFVFCIGLIFNLLSVVIGILTNNVLTSNYIAFTIWSMSCLIAGLYFPMDAASKFWANASKLMPQNWVLKATDMLMAGKSGAYTMYILVVFGYMILIMSTGYIGIKLRRKE